jgi:hypothetical protein
MMIIDSLSPASDDSVDPTLTAIEIPRPDRMVPRPLVDDPPIDPDWEDWAAEHLDPRIRL